MRQGAYKTIHSFFSHPDFGHSLIIAASLYCWFRSCEGLFITIFALTESAAKCGSRTLPPVGIYTPPQRIFHFPTDSLAQQSDKALSYSHFKRKGSASCGRSSHERAREFDGPKRADGASAHLRTARGHHHHGGYGHRRRPVHDGR